MTALGPVGAAQELAPGGLVGADHKTVAAVRAHLLRRLAVGQFAGRGRHAKSSNPLQPYRPESTRTA